MGVPKLNILEVIRAIVIDLINHTIDNTLSSIGSWDRPFKSITVVVKTIPNLPCFEMGILKICVSLVMTSPCSLRECIICQGKNNHIKLMSR